MADTTAPAADAPTLWRPKHSPWLITISVLLATFMEVLDTSIANVSLPHIAGNLSATAEESTWVLTSYLISNAIILSAAGWFSRYFGRKRFLSFSVILFTLSSALCGLAHSLPFLIFARILQGIGGGGLQPVAQAILLESFPPKDRGKAMAAYGMGIVVAPIIGPILGGWITDNFNWRWIFFINIPVGLIGLAMQQVFLEDPPYMQKVSGVKIDYIGFGLMALGIGLLQIILDKGQNSDWFGSAWICWSTAVVVVALVSFVLWELRVKEPIVNIRILKNRNFATGTLLMTVLGGVLYGSTVILPIFMQGLLNYTALQSGLAMTPRGVGAFLSMIMVGKLVQRFDSRMMIFAGFFGIGGACLMLSQLSFDITTGNVAWPLFLNGLCMGFVFVPMTTMSVSTLKQEEIAQSTGLYSLMRNMGGGIGISIVVTLQQRWAQLHQANLVAHATPYDAAYNSNLGSMSTTLIDKGISAAQASSMALQSAYRGLIHQAALLSFMDCFRWMAITCVVCAPLVLLFRKGKSAGGHAMME